MTTLTRVESGIALAAERLPAGAPLRLSLALSGGSVRAGFGWVSFMKRTGGTVLMFLLPVITFLGLLATFWLRGRDPAVLEETEWQTSVRTPLPEIAGAGRRVGVAGRLRSGMKGYGSRRRSDNRPLA